MNWRHRFLALVGTSSLLRRERGEEAASKTSWLLNRNLLFQQTQANPERQSLARERGRAWWANHGPGCKHAAFETEP
jgi:hypothetical protein